ncbi:hypothetical protein ABNP34_16435 (plasmid) [Glutamicibacter mishrai]|uniref:hypothetical protein n=1 Tax=Glutamicibacter mishrai TaxID=1775880 RepID=UPI0032EFE0DB
MRKTLLSIQLDDEQVDDLVAALSAYRDHFVELIELNTEAIGPHARENDRQWQNKVSHVQEMIDPLNESLYGARTGNVRVDVSQDFPHAAA